MKITNNKIAAIEAEVIRRCNESPEFKARVLSIINGKR